jgi:hypothetical protein
LSHGCRAPPQWIQVNASSARPHHPPANAHCG